jgi:hypothetical protein
MGGIRPLGSPFAPLLLLLLFNFGQQRTVITSFLKDSPHCKIFWWIGTLPGMAKPTIFKITTIARAKAAASKSQSAKKKAPHDQETLATQV